MNNKELIKQITKDLKLCSEWSEKNKIIMEEYKNRNFQDDRNCDLCENCNKRFDQQRDVLWNDDISAIWFKIQDDGLDEGDLCADCISKHT